jgi:hypothetical protein
MAVPGDGRCVRIDGTGGEGAAAGVHVVLVAGGVLVWLLASCPQARGERKIFIPRVRCRACGVSHALLPAFALSRRLDAAEPVGAVIGQVAGGACGVRPAAAAAGVPYTTARGWVRRFAALQQVWARLGFEHFRDGVHLLDPSLQRSRQVTKIISVKPASAARCCAPTPRNGHGWPASATT